MSVARHYVMTARPGAEGELRKSLNDLVVTLRDIPGYEGADILQDIAIAQRFVFIEKWASVDDHKSGGKLVSKPALNAVMAKLAEPPEGGYLQYV